MKDHPDAQNRKAPNEADPADALDELRESEEERGDPATLGDLPEADALEQSRPVQPGADDEVATDDEVSEADALEQARGVEGDEEERR
jgi:hypothetical protein